MIIRSCREPSGNQLLPALTEDFGSTGFKKAADGGESVRYSGDQVMLSPCPLPVRLLSSPARGALHGLLQALLKLSSQEPSRCPSKPGLDIALHAPPCFPIPQPLLSAREVL